MIKIDNLSYTYSNGTKALNNINLSFSEGEIVLIIGENGSGKSTLLSSIANIYKYQGAIYLDDVDIKKIPNKEFRKQLGIVFQDPNNQVIFNKVYDDMCFSLDNLDISNKDEVIKEALEIVSMEEFLESNPYYLSMGQKQRLALANVLATNPKYLLLDEITSMLDYRGKQDIYDLIVKLKKKNIGVIMGTNILDELIYADRIIILKGDVKENLTKKELFNNLDILTKYGFTIPFNLKIIQKIGVEKLNLDNLTEDELLRYVN